MSAQFLVRAHDPLTSVLAAENAAHFAGKHRERICAALQDLGMATAAEIGMTTGLSVEQVARRLPELRRGNRAEVVQIEGADLMRDGYRVWRAK